MFLDALITGLIAGVFMGFTVWLVWLSVVLVTWVGRKRDNNDE